MTATRLLQCCGLASLLVLATTPYADASAVTYVLVREDDVTNEDSHTDPGSSAASLSLPLGSAWADVSIPAGTLRAYAQTTTSDVSGVHGADTNAYASSEDYYTLVGLAPGTQVWLTGYLNVVGHLVTDPADSFVDYSGFSANFGGSGTVQVLASPPGGESAIDEQLAQVFFVTAGTPFRVVAELSAYATGWNSYDALADFGGTAVLRFDLSGLPEGVSISSAEGFFQPSVAAVPEPASALLFCSALFALAGFAARRRT